MINIRVICLWKYRCVLQCVYIYIFPLFSLLNSKGTSIYGIGREIFGRETPPEWVESNQDHSLKMKGFKGGSRKVKCRGPPIDFRHRLVPSTTVTVICIEYFTLYLLLHFLSRSSSCTCIVLAVNVLGYSYVKSI